MFSRQKRGIDEVHSFNGVVVPRRSPKQHSMSWKGRVRTIVAILRDVENQRSVVELNHLSAMIS
jgi:hypothetical protein